MTQYAPVASTVSGHENHNGGQKANEECDDFDDDFEDDFGDEGGDDNRRQNGFNAELPLVPIESQTASELINSGLVKCAMAQVIPQPMYAEAEPRVKRQRSNNQAASSEDKQRFKRAEPKLFDWNNPECCFGLLGCAVTNLRCDYCGEEVNSTEKSFHKRCKLEFLE